MIDLHHTPLASNPVGHCSPPIIPIPWLNLPKLSWMHYLLMQGSSETNLMWEMLSPMKQTFCLPASTTYTDSCQTLVPLACVNLDVLLLVESACTPMQQQPSSYPSIRVKKDTQPSEAEEWLILVQRGYYNNPVPAYFSTSHLLILIQTRISISRLWTIVSRLWTIVSLVVDYYNPVVDYYKPGCCIVSESTQLSCPSLYGKKSYANSRRNADQRAHDHGGRRRRPHPFHTRDTLETQQEGQAKPQQSEQSSTHSRNRPPHHFPSHRSFQ